MTNDLSASTSTPMTHLDILDSETNKTNKTNKTNETNIVDNNIFLSTIFSTVLNNAYPIVVSFKGNPTSVSNKKWFGHPWTGNSFFLAAEQNNYFSLALFRADDSGQYRRKKSHFHGLYAVMLD